MGAWIDHHGELPRLMARRIRRHFKHVLQEKTALDDSEVLKELSPELRCDVSRFIIHDDVRYNLLFEGLPATVLAKLVPILQTTHVEANEKIVSHNEPGVAMFIIVEGTATMRWEASASVQSSIGVGDSFGEEIILRLEERYMYTVVSTSKMSTNMIPEDAFQECFQTMPDVIVQMTGNFQRST